MGQVRLEQMLEQHSVPDDHSTVKCNTLLLQMGHVKLDAIVPNKFSSIVENALEFGVVRSLKGDAECMAGTLRKAYTQNLAAGHVGFYVEGEGSRGKVTDGL